MVEPRTADATTADVDPTDADASTRTPRVRWCLVVVWSAAEPERVGEVALIEPRRSYVLGRDGTWLAGAMPVLFAPRRDEALVPGRPLSGRAISRRQMEVEVDGGSLRVRNVGRCKLIVEGAAVDEVRVPAGRCLVLAGQAVLLCERRESIAPVVDPQDFGAEDAFGVVGESPAIWRLRERLRFLAGSDEHVLLLGESGTGKELAARALHGLSPRGDRAMVSRNAATLPEGLIDCELFGNVEGYPNPGTAGREGLVGAADGSTLFLDEIGELPPALQSHLLRVLDRDGEYQRLGEDRMRRSRLRLVAATNRPASALKHDLAARLPLRLTVPSLNERRGDIGLLVPHLLRRAAASTPEVATRYFVGGDTEGRPRVAPDLMAALVEHQYELHIRELVTLLWRSIAESEGDTLRLVPELASVLSPAPADTSGGGADGSAVEDALRRSAGNVSRAARALGMSRHALHRLIRKLDLDPQRYRP